MISPAEAWARLEPHLAPLAAESLPRREAAGRVLARELLATVDVPALDVSAMDGYALAGSAAPGQPVEVVGTVAAGDAPGLVVPPGKAARIMTGAPLPHGADRVVAIEETDGGQTMVVVHEPPAEGVNVRRRGEIQRLGSALLPAGQLLSPGALSLLATHGYAAVDVHRAPRVAVLATGDEVVAPDETPAPGQLRDSHTDFLLAATRDLGLEAVSLGIAPDEPEALRDLVARGLEFDVLLVTGGVSMGAYDLVEGVLEKLGCTVLFEKVAIQPAKPVVAAIHVGGLVFGLPGNPASAMVAFWLFVRPSLRRLLGSPDAFWQGALAATLETPLPPARDRDRYLPAIVRFEAGEIFTRALLPQGSHDLAAYARGNALLRLPAGSPAAEPGDRREILPLADWRAG